MSSIAILILFGGVSVMVLGAALVVLLVMFVIYKMDATYPQHGFWKNVRLEVAELLTGTLAR